MSVPFVKMEACGNDFAVIRAGDLPTDFDAAWVRAACDRHFGIGGDGVLVLGDGPSMVVWNADGSIAETCGNGLRCIALRLAEDESVRDGVIGSGAGPVRFRPTESGWEVALRGPRAPAEDESITLPRGPVRGVRVDLGNPHFVVFGDPADLDVLGPALTGHPAFPAGTNVEIVRADGPGAFAGRVWERGVGETLACGSGACAVGVAAIRSGKASGPVAVSLPGGTLSVRWDGDGGPVWLSGPARTVFRGVYTPNRKAEP